MKTLREFNLKGKRILVRCDFNVPLGEQGDILDDFRIRQSIPTIEYLTKERAKVILMSHLDRPGGKVIEKLRLTPIQDKLMEYLDLSVVKAPDCLGKEIERWSHQMKNGEILLLENLRFHKEEEENEEGFAKELAKLGDIYINDAFGVSHRNHASVVGVPKFLPSGAGFLLEKEIKVLTGLMEKPKKPLVAIIGGKKVETKTKLIDKISEIADFILIGSLIKKEIKEKNIQLRYHSKIIEPSDSIEGKDIGPQTIKNFKEKINLAKTIFWSGPLGKIEEVKFQMGSKTIAQTIINSGAFSVIGGGETVEFVNQSGLIEKFNHASTGGGAMIAFISGEKIPGIEVLK